jgi:hypothetical protein
MESTRRVFPGLRHWLACRRYEIFVTAFAGYTPSWKRFDQAF